MQFQTLTWLYYLQFVLFPSSSKTPQTIIKCKKRENVWGWMQWRGTAIHQELAERYREQIVCPGSMLLLIVLEGLCVLERYSVCVSWKGVM